jgi:hypothetical protein
MRNGRAAISGTCPRCGARVVTTARTTASVEMKRTPSPARADRIRCAASTQPKETEMAKDKKAKKDNKPVKKGK